MPARSTPAQKRRLKKMISDAKKQSNKLIAAERKAEVKAKAMAKVKVDPQLVKLERAVAKLVKGGLKIPPSGIKITRSRHGISVSKIEMKRKLRKRKAKKAAAKK